MGPNTPVANGTLLGAVQAQGDYMAKVSFFKIKSDDNSIFGKCKLKM
jgi:hypothetical protein